MTAEFREQMLAVAKMVKHLKDKAQIKGFEHERTNLQRAWLDLLRAIKNSEVYCSECGQPMRWVISAGKEVERR